MDPVCKCGKKIDSKRDINIEEISGGIGDKNYRIAIVYCENCSHIFGAFPTKGMFKDMMKEIFAEGKK